ncbi:MAG TPA: Maf family protein [Candidatus Cloacimonadota bacterium]|nr:Maf family protein [Candidatus Cloacimonadota bacterium]
MIHNILKNNRIVLASQSPRRKQLLEMIGLRPLIVPARIEEPMLDTPPYKQVMTHAENKATAIKDLFDNDTMIIGSDTLVFVDGKILGKPMDSNEIETHLNLLSGKTHAVYTGICILWKNNIIKDYQRTQVRFKTLTDKEIESYIKTKEPNDKAGSYGIQGYGSQFIESIRGCYFNVMGFPINLFYDMIRRLNCEE